MQQRDLLLVPFPFSNQSGRKVRPVIIISNDIFNSKSEDFLVVGVTSNIKNDDYSISFQNKDLDGGKLFTDCAIKVDNLLKIDKELIIKKIGVVSQLKFRQIISRIKTIID